MNISVDLQICQQFKLSFFLKRIRIHCTTVHGLMLVVGIHVYIVKVLVLGWERMVLYAVLRYNT